MILLFRWDTLNGGLFVTYNKDFKNVALKHKSSFHLMDTWKSSANWGRNWAVTYDLAIIYNLSHNLLMEGGSPKREQISLVAPSKISFWDKRS